MQTSGTIEALEIAISALKRIKRKPGWPPEHKLVREFYPIGGGPVRTAEANARHDALWMPSWAVDEHNPCDCIKCIAIHTLEDMQAALVDRELTKSA